jgi:hypothetical protein
VTEDHTIRELLAPMIEAAVDLRGRHFQVNRERVVASMARATWPRSPKRHRWLGGLLLAAAGFVGLVGGLRLWRRPSARVSLRVLASHGSVAHVRDAARVNLEAESDRGAVIPAEGELATAAESSARLRTPEGIELELLAQTRISLGRIEARASEVRLMSGSLRCTVPHTTTSGFRVITPDVTVLDQGTVFSVSLDESGQTSRVSVEEGEVTVASARGRVRVRAPDSWSSLASWLGPSPSLEPATSGGSERPFVGVAKQVHSSGSATGRQAANLEEEAQLLRDGLAAERQGRAADAAATLNELLSKYPRSPLAPDARQALARVRARQEQ